MTEPWSQLIPPVLPEWKCCSPFWAVGFKIWLEQESKGGCSWTTACPLDLPMVTSVVTMWKCYSLFGGGGGDWGFSQVDFIDINGSCMAKSFGALKISKIFFREGLKYLSQNKAYSVLPVIVIMGVLIYWFVLWLQLQDNCANNSFFSICWPSKIILIFLVK